jgi:hypothetical protein
MRSTVVPGATLVPVGGPTGLGAPSAIDAIIERTGKGTGPGNDERIETPTVQIDEQLASLWAHFTLTRPGETRIGVCGVNMFLLRKGPDGWKIFQIATTSRTEGCGRTSNTAGGLRVPRLTRRAATISILRMPTSPPKLFEYTLPGDWTVLAGRTDADNDRLSIKLAAANDYWFHVRGTTGSHVVLRVDRNEEPDRATLEGAAAIAAYHSKARNAGVVSVSCTRAKYVTKPHGARPGTVEIRNESVLKVRPKLPSGSLRS